MPMNDDFNAKRTVKDSVFTHLFQDRHYTLQLFQALHPEAQNVTEDMIELVTLEHVLVERNYNDLGFRVGEHLIVLVEAQSTWTVNIIVRLLMYLTKTYQEFINRRELNVYSSTPLRIPKPELYVIYTGNTHIKKDIITLSEEFFGGEQIDVDVRVHVLTGGRQGDIIYQYVAFAKVFDDQVKLYGRTQQAITETLRICKDRNLLKQYLTEHEQEVVDIMITLFDQETIMRSYTKETFEKGVAEGEKNGEKKNAIETAKRMLLRMMPPELVAELCNLPLTEVNALQAQLAH